MADVKATETRSAEARTIIRSIAAATRTVSVRAQTQTRPIGVGLATASIVARSQPQGPPGPPATDLLIAKGDLLTRDPTMNVRLPVGSDGQLLSAASAEAEGINWIDPPAADPLTTKGDVLTHDGASSLRLPVGSDGQLLSADSAQAEGINWIDPPAADPLTTKGDLLVHDGASSIRFPVGADRQVLIANAAQPEGVEWIRGLPSLAIPRTSELLIDFTTLATFPTYVTLLTATITTLLASSYLAFDFTCALRHTGAFAGNVAPSIRLRLDGTLLPGGDTVNMPRSRIMPMAEQGRVVVSAGVHTLIVEITKFAGPANTLAISPVSLLNLDHASLTVREEF